MILFAVSYSLQNLLPLKPEWIESTYSNGVNLYFRQLQGLLFNPFPFSVAEVMVVLGVIALALWVLFLLVSLVRHPRKSYKVFFKRLGATVLLLATLYSCFILFWGLNYQRPSILDTENVLQSTAQLEKLSRLLVNEANTLRKELTTESLRQGFTPSVFATYQQDMANLYDQIALAYPSLRGHYSRPKPIALSIPFSYTGIVGIYFPFTGEANINTNEVPFMLPSTMAHEMAHQRGYAKEEDANFIAYLVLKGSNHLSYRYSGTILALIHATNRLYQDSPEAYQRVRALYSQELIDDLQYSNAYWQPYRGKVEEKATQMNDNYLKSNRQSDGVVSYSLMIKLLLAYYEEELR
jgi:hypothetical protein